MTTKVFLGGISPNTTSESIRFHFEKYGIITDTVAMMKDGQPRGFGFVTFESLESVDAMFMDGEQNLDGRVIECKVATPEGSMGAPAARNGGGYGAKASKGPSYGKGGGGAKGKDSYGSPYGGGGPYHQFDSFGSNSKGGFGKGSKGGGDKGMKGGAKGKGGGGGGGGGGVKANKLFVGGLSAGTTDDMLADYFGVFGNLIDHVVMMDKVTGKPKGFGFVQYDDAEPVEAVMADYSNHQIDGKWIEVKRAQSAESLGGGGGGGYGGGGYAQSYAPPTSSYASHGVVNPYSSYGPAPTKGGGKRPQPYGRY